MWNKQKEVCPWQTHVENQVVHRDLKMENLLGADGWNGCWKLDRLLKVRAIKMVKAPQQQNHQ